MAGAATAAGVLSPALAAGESAVTAGIINTKAEKPTLRSTHFNFKSSLPRIAPDGLCAVIVASVSDVAGVVLQCRVATAAGLWTGLYITSQFWPVRGGDAPTLAHDVNAVVATGRGPPSASNAF